MFNKVVLVGNLTRDIELRYSQGGSAIANTAIATSRKFTVNGEKKEETCFVDITFFGRSGEIANQYLRKGSKILVEGRLSFEQWVDKTSGQKRSKHSVIVETMQMLDNKDSSGYSEPASDNSSGYSDKPYQAPAPQYEKHTDYQAKEEEPKEPLHDKQGSLPMGDDEIPF
jgi:single-strand DNA-binding protein